MDEDKSSSGEALATKIAQLASGFCLDNNNWKMMGFKKRPRRGALFTSFVKIDVLIQEKFILRELLISCIVDCIDAVANKYVIEYRLKIAARAIEKLLLADGCINAFYFDTYHEARLYFTDSLKDYFNNESVSVVFTMHATNILEQAFKGAWLVNIPQIFVGDTIFSLKVYLNENFEHTLTDDIELQDNKIMELLQTAIT